MLFWEETKELVNLGQAELIIKDKGKAKLQEIGFSNGKMLISVFSK